MFAAEESMPPGFCFVCRSSLTTRKASSAFSSRQTLNTMLESDDVTVIPANVGYFDLMVGFISRNWFNVMANIARLARFGLDLAQ